MIRSRLVGKELKAKTKDALLAYELFSATPPWEAIKALLSMLVTDGMVEDGEELELGVFDISRAQFIPEVKRELYVELPDEDRLEGQGDMIGRLNRNMYGFRDASNGWMEELQKLLESAGYVVGVSKPALFLNPVKKRRGAVHGDDFYVLAGRKAIDHISSVLGSKYSMRESHRLGFGERCTQSAAILNRVVTLGYGVDGRRFLQIEPDSRHVDLILEGDRTKSVATPRVKRTDEHEVQRREEPTLGREETTLYCSNVMRASFLAQDRIDLCETVKVLARRMSTPSRSDMEDLKHFARYLKGKPSLAFRYDQQAKPTCIRVSADSDHAAGR